MFFRKFSTHPMTTSDSGANKSTTPSFKIFTSEQVGTMYMVCGMPFKSNETSCLFPQQNRMNDGTSNPITEARTNTSEKLRQQRPYNV